MSSAMAFGTCTRLVARSASSASTATANLRARTSGFVAGRHVGWTAAPSTHRGFRSTAISMALKTGIVGLPNVGKSTLFNALVENSTAEVSERASLRPPQRRGEDTRVPEHLFISFPSFFFSPFFSLRRRQGMVLLPKTYTLKRAHGCLSSPAFSAFRARVPPRRQGRSLPRSRSPGPPSLPSPRSFVRARFGNLHGAHCHYQISSAECALQHASSGLGEEGGR